MPDTLTRLGNSLIQHGPSSDRIYALELAVSDMPEILDELDEMATSQGYGKIIAKGRRTHFEEFVTRGYLPEAVVPSFFGPEEDGVFMGKFLEANRMREGEPDRVQEVLDVARREGSASGPEGPGRTPSKEEADGEEEVPGITIREASPKDLEALAACYGAVFESYPFPIQDPSHLRHEQEEGTRFFTAWEEGALVAASSMEPGGAPGTVEMTDFATLPSQRGRGLATRLLAIMDEAAEEIGERVAYTIARAVSFGMNIAFARRSYRFGGTLVNNTQIGGSVESMNIWYKLLDKE